MFGSMYSSLNVRLVLSSVVVLNGLYGGDILMRFVLMMLRLCVLCMIFSVCGMVRLLIFGVLVLGV